ncbi:hypothetical protein QFZ34_002031 [Phyllobacterium ifriqiyense]|uniref:DUF3010 domain-containing protein n=1 Tax=Phyllobacterium ifriqiyense TaxID=314238 RepID=A0ABU0S7Z0_9HYPH|nr:DUF3010 family protein [Phyllobacterium ifriqiyense]MDQ0996849.1 hypothetical protein [Phyllobacterium ifriqiyense]
MIVCGVDLKSSEARLVLVSVENNDPHLIPCKTKKLTLGDDKDSSAIKSFLQAIKTFAHENGVAVFAIKARAKGGQMGGGAISFKIETLFQLSDCDVVFVNATALSKFSKTNLGGIPDGVLKYQYDAYRCGVFQLAKAGRL